MNTILFPGSFNPFTVGHQSLVSRILPLFDRVVIAVGVNSGKETGPQTDTRVEEIRALYASEPKVSVIAYSGLTVDACEAQGARWMLRGVRSAVDFEYERNLADINRRISGIETLLLFTLPEYAAVSSSVVRELRSYGRDVSEFIPQP
ncbi:MAG: pantetheine-phosphate adenylyltransferase [Duncaniella sp.]|uniref:pantetheine-phosphate adenylyltransferase n=1 Tax=Duncaniella sp. TaxID=2518496 RepID=UPI0023C08A2C|nr:pantetheine-phosphate adenylyltransferase [Duncaniella sp.]MDE5988495.1 pantetheine-phosphate adenylyltransferase [Duncaniella sp.]MDE6175002.1 pantetheine-phosphate adenylyltransferase [Duncaniella sp.]